jgi:selenide,water dikinase
VYQWEAGPALVQTVDFFTPIVDDPYVYGQIAAANAVSDIYAMGGRPLTALAIAGFPKETLDHDVIRQIFRGGHDKLREAGIALLGGHTVQDREVKFGYAVTGAVDPTRILTNAGARPGDAVFLTKPLGTGIVGTAIKFDRAGAVGMDEAVASMRTLNRRAAEAIQTLAPGSVHACTDITGFGFVGHTTEMARASHVTVAVHANAIPTFGGVLDVAAQNRSGGLSSNEQHFGATTQIAAGVDPNLVSVLYDPQTSGGLLIAVDAAAANDLSRALEALGVRAPRVGVAEPANDGVYVVVRP